jgi:hypothetical protein
MLFLRRTPTVDPSLFYAFRSIVVQPRRHVRLEVRRRRRRVHVLQSGPDPQICPLRPLAGIAPRPRLRRLLLRRPLGVSDRRGPR